MKKSMYVFALLIAATQLFAQKKSPASEVRVPLNAASWDSKNGEMKFGDHNGVPSMELTSGGQLVTSKDLVFANGTLEFDVEFMGGFTGCYFRRESDDESEFFYLRNRAGDPNKLDAVQYAPVVKKVNLWDVLPGYQTAANFKTGEWTHIKMVVSGNQMLVYVNSKTRPTLQIPHLEGNTKQGGIGFTGRCFISNVVVRHNEVEGLSPAEGFDPIYHDIRFIRNWHVSQPVSFPKGQELYNDNLPDEKVTWQKVSAERLGLVNLTRLYGNSESRRLAWLRKTITVKADKKVKVDLGFSDEIWVFANNKLAYADKNLYTQDMRKEPDGRLSIENASFELSLKAGENDLLIGLANDFYGWGLIARLENLDDIELSDFKPEVINKEYEPYFGVYASTQVPLKIKVSQIRGKLSAQPSGQGPLLMTDAGKGVFTYEEYKITLEFTPAEKKMILKEGMQQIDFFKE